MEIDLDLSSLDAVIEIAKENLDDPYWRRVLTDCQNLRLIHERKARDQALPANLTPREKKRRMFK